MPVPPTRTRWRPVTLALAGALIALALPVVALSASAVQPRLSVAGLSAASTKDAVVNRAITTSFDVAFTQPHAKALASFIASLSDPASPHYHHYLTPSQYAARFGATKAAIDAVRDYFQGFGLSVGHVSKGHNIVRVVGTTTDIAHAFDASVETVRLATGVLDAHFVTPGTLPRAIANDVAGVAGLSTVSPEVTSLERPASTTTQTTPPATCPSAGTTTGSTPVNGGYTVQQEGELYGLSAEWAAGDTGVGQTIGVYELASYNANDVATFLSCYGVNSNITSVSIDGGPTASDNDEASENEATLDVEEAQVLAPGINVIVYQGTQAGSGPTDIYNEIASDDTASVVTTSWGICEPETDGAAQVEQPIFEEMAAQGQTMVAAAGDEGSSDCEGASPSEPSPAVDDPASQPYVTGVGGLTVTSIDPLDETVWNDGCTRSTCGAGGGGESILWTQPSWQVAPGITTTASTGGMRMVPDLSVMADPSTGFIEYYTGDTGSCIRDCASGWGAIGGTSIGAPLVADMVAIAAQACDVPSGRLGFVNPSLYAMASSGFNEVTTGNNDLFGVGVYSAGPGYNMASGLGSPDGAAFFAGLCPPPLSPTLSSFTVSTTTPTGATVPTIAATLRNTDDQPLADTTVKVEATAASGTLAIDGDAATASGTGDATDQVTTDANGVATFTVSSSVAQSVTVNITYDGSSIYTTTITFNAVSTKPQSPSITSLKPLVGGFALRLGPPSSNGGSPITAYQYSLNGGRTWVTIPDGARSISVTSLKRGAAYEVRARDENAIGASPASAAKRVVTRS